MPHLVIGGTLYGSAFVIYELTRSDEFAVIFAIAGGLWAGVGVIKAIAHLFKSEIKPHIASAVQEKAKVRAYDDLIRYKKLFDEKLITEEEFQEKSRELKAKLL